MVCLAEDLVVWKDFPKGLRVLLLDEDGCSGAETKLKLEAMDYIVCLYFNEDDAIEAIEKKAENFHVAIVEVSTDSSCRSFRFFEVARDLPIIVISDVQHLSIMMKCIALGAAEFLQKPLSEDKLRNIWQHAVYKAFNAGGINLSKSLKPVKEIVVSILRLQSKTAEIKIENLLDAENSERVDCVENRVASENLAAPSTPQLEQGERLQTTADGQEITNCSTERESTEEIKGLQQEKNSSSFVSKSVDNACNNLITVSNVQEALPPKDGEAVAEEEVNSADASSTVIEGSRPSSHLHNVVVEDQKKKKNSILNKSSCSNNKNSRKKIKVDWTPELHKKFVQAVEQLGIDQAIPSKILELMKVEGLTRHNIASHLQKYRMHKRHILPKDDDRRWQHHRNPTQRGCLPKPLLAYPPFYPNYNLAQSQVYPVVWGHVSYQPHGYYMLPHAGFQTWHPPAEASSWKDYSVIQADAWGCPVVPQYGEYPLHTPRAPVITSMDATGDENKMWTSSCDLMAEETIDEAVKEAMSKPWLPLPLGLKSPSTDAVLAELHRQGIGTVPPAATPVLRHASHS